MLKIVQNDYLYKIEKEYIDSFSKKYKLTNQTEGGLGGDTFTMLSNERKEEISKLIRNKNLGTKKSEMFKKNLSDSRTGLGNPMVGTSKIGWVICFDLNDNPIQLMKYPFEIADFLNKVNNTNKDKRFNNAKGNISKGIRSNKSRSVVSNNYK